MKNYFFLGLILLFSACSSDSGSEENNPDLTVTLLKKIDEQNGVNGHATIRFYYDGRKLVKVKNQLIYDDSWINTDYYYYTNDLITEIKRYDKYDDFVIDTKFVYDTNSKLTTMIRSEFSSNHGSRKEFTYNPDGTVSIVNYEGTLDSQTDLTETYLFHFLSDNVIHIEYSGYGSTVWIFNEFDIANTPIKNITGFDKIFNYYFIEGTHSSFLNNITVTSIYEVGAPEKIFNYTISYNQDNYPTYISWIGSNNQTGSYTYTYF